MNFSARIGSASLARIIIVRLLLYTSLLMGCVGLINYLHEHFRLDDQLRKNLTIFTDRLSSDLALSVWNADERQILNNISSGMLDRAIQGIVLRVQEKSYFFTRDAAWSVVEVKKQFPETGLIPKASPVVFNGREIGLMTVYATPRFMREELRHVLFVTCASIVLFELILVLVLYLLLWTTILRPVARLEEYATAVSSGKRVAPAESADFEGELGILRSTMERMVAQLDSRYAELQAFRENLEITVEERTADLSKAKLTAENAQTAAETANRAKSGFLAAMSHEIRTPMNAILGYAQMMSRDTALLPDQRDKIHTINRAGEHLLSLINDVLEMSKIEAGTITRNDSAFDLHSLLDDVVEIYSGRACDRGLSLMLERSMQLPRHIISDESKVRQALVNLLGNAVKFTSSGGIVLLADSVTDSNGSHKITLSVRDSGPGIRPEEFEKLFHPFVQSDAGKSVGGTGLGLAISRQYARLLGGDITVDSKPGQGATFAFTFRAASASAGDVIARDAAPPVRHLASGQTVRILVADDVEASRDLLFYLLTDLGFEVRVAVNGVEALTIFKEWMPHAILMDMQMPVMNGYEAIRRIKAMPEGRCTTVLALTASAFEEDKAAVLASGADEFARKPFKENELLALLGRRLNLRFQDESTEIAVAPVAAIEFHRIPKTLRGELLKASREADYDGLLALCNKLATAGHPAEAEALRARLKAFDYHGFATLLGEKGATDIAVFP